MQCPARCRKDLYMIFETIWTIIIRRAENGMVGIDKCGIGCDGGG